MKKQFFPKLLMGAILFFALFTGNHQSVQAQDISTYQYRHVAPDKIAEFIKRETTYWSKVAQAAIDKGNLTFWALCEKVGGSEEPNSPNFLFVNTYKDINNVNSVWNPAVVFPNIPLDKMETNSISTTIATIFVRDYAWQQSAKAVPAKDFKYLVYNYYYSSEPSTFVELEKKYWGPFIKSTMDNNEVTQVAWGNSIILSPRPSGGDMKFNSLSVDIFPTLKDALMPNWSSNVTFPREELDSLHKISLTPSASNIFRVVKVVTK